MVLWIVTLCELVSKKQRFGETHCCLHHQVRGNTSDSVYSTYPMHFLYIKTTLVHSHITVGSALFQTNVERNFVVASQYLLFVLDI